MEKQIRQELILRRIEILLKNRSKLLEQIANIPGKDETLLNAYGHIDEAYIKVIILEAGHL